MTSPVQQPADRIRYLVGAGKISAAEGERLILALSEPKGSSSRFELAYNPFVRFGGGTAALAGLVLGAASLLLTRTGVHFDGFLDLHFAKAIASWRLVFIEQIVVLPIPALIFAAVAAALGGHKRVLDYLGVIGLARLPYVVLALPMHLLLEGGPERPKLEMTTAIGAVLGAIALAWTLTWLYQGFKNASGLRGAKLVGGFVAAVIAAEIVSKVVIAFAT